MIRFLGSFVAAVTLLMVVLAPSDDVTAVSTTEVKEPPLFPVAIDIPKLDARSNLIPLDLDPSGTELTAPPIDKPWQAGWYVDGVVPGVPGPAVIAAHVNGVVYAGDKRLSMPGLFYDLRKLAPGDKIHILLADYSEVTFDVTEIKQYAKAEVPVDDIYGDTPGPTLRLITCGGAYDAKNRSFVDNIIVYAELRKQ